MLSSCASSRNSKRDVEAAGVEAAGVEVAGGVETACAGGTPAEPAAPADEATANGIVGDNVAPRGSGSCQG